jgi:GNAT superfamily N-acetyltransferase
MTADDAAAVQPLLVQLGYDMSVAEVTQRLASVLGAENHAVFVAQSAERVVGLLHIYARPALEKPPEAVVQALVVDATGRRGGVGARLMDVAERWAAERGFRSVALSSNVVRDDAHAFYTARGYALVATGHLFRKRLYAAPVAQQWRRAGWGPGDGHGGGVEKTRVRPLHVQPPSMTKLWAVARRLSSAASHSTRRATSAG